MLYPNHLSQQVLILQDYHSKQLEQPQQHLLIKQMRDLPWMKHNQMKRRSQIGAHMIQICVYSRLKGQIFSQIQNIHQEDSERHWGLTQEDPSLFWVQESGLQNACWLAIASYLYCSLCTHTHTRLCMPTLCVAISPLFF